MIYDDGKDMSPEADALVIAIEALDDEDIKRLLSRIDVCLDCGGRVARGSRCSCHVLDRD